MQLKQDAYQVGHDVTEIWEGRVRSFMLKCRTERLPGDAATAATLACLWCMAKRLRA